jgi:GNAT superfamily N-acetyltransferase
MNDRFLYTTPLDSRAKPLLDELAVEYDTRYGDLLREPGEPREMERYPADVFAPPQGNFLLLLRGGVAIGGGAFKRLDDDTAELKRMWTRSDLRRRGLSRQVLVELEAQVRRQGYRRIYLTTGFRQPEAVGLYLGHGYTPLFDRSVGAEMPRKLPFEKQLGPATAHPAGFSTTEHHFAEQDTRP